MDEIKVPIYLMTGFLESGKTSFLSFTIQQDYFHTDGKTLLILCEEGEEEYDPAILEANNTVVEVIENEEDFTTDRLVAMDILHHDRDDDAHVLHDHGHDDVRHVHAHVRIPGIPPLLPSAHLPEIPDTP